MADTPAVPVAVEEPVDPALTAAVSVAGGAGTVDGDATVARSGAVTPGTVSVADGEGNTVVTVDAAQRTVAVVDGDPVSLQAPGPVATAVQEVTSARAAFDQEINGFVRGLVDDRVEAAFDGAAAAAGQAQTTAREMAFDAVAGQVPVEASQTAAGTTVTVAVDEAQ